MAELTRNWRPEKQGKIRTTSQPGDFAQYTLPDLRLFQNRPLAVSARAITPWLCSIPVFQASIRTAVQAGEYKGIHDAEDGCVAGYSDRKREHCDERESGVVPEHARGIPKVVV